MGEFKYAGGRCWVLEGKPPKNKPRLNRVPVPKHSLHLKGQRNQAEQIVRHEIHEIKVEVIIKKEV